MPRAKSIDNALMLNSQQTALLLGINGGTLRQFVTDGMPVSPVTGPQGGARYDACHVVAWLIERRVQEAVDEIDVARLQSLDRERARLTRAQSEKTEMEIARAKRELAPIAMIEAPLRSLAKLIADHCAALPLRIRNRIPELTATQLEWVRFEIARWQNEALDLPDRVELG